MQTSKKLLAFTGAALCAAAVMYGSDAVVSARAQGDGGEFSAKFWDWVSKVRYKQWAPWPGQSGDFYPGQSPHGAKLKMYINRPAAANPENPGDGAVIVKENYTPDNELAAITIMYRTKGYDPDHNDWYWVKYTPDGTVAKAPAEKGGQPLAGKVKSCINCHGTAGGGDYIFANDNE